MTDQNTPIDYTDLTCGTCLHFRDPAGDAPGGSCWLEPPVPVSIPVQGSPGGLTMPKNATSPQGTGVMTFATRPPVTANTPACGQWEPAGVPVFRASGPRDTPDVDA